MVILVAGLLMGGLYLLQRILYRRMWDRELTVSLNFEKETIRAGETVSLYEVIENKKWMPLPSLKVKFCCSRHLEFQDRDNSRVTDQYYRNDLFSLMPYKRITRTHRILCRQRGCYGISSIGLVGVDLFFSEEMIAKSNTSAILYVLPKPLEPGCLETALARINGELATRRQELPDPFTFRGIRDYEVYDEPKSVNWRATARTGELKVNIRENTAMGSVRIFMNLADNDILRREELLEMCISICARLCEKLLAEGVRVSVYANARDCISGQMLQLEGYLDTTGLDAVCKSLARLDLNAPMENFEAAFRGRLYEEQNTAYTLFLSPDRHEDHRRMIQDYQSSKGDCLWICPVKNKKEMQEAKDAGIEAFLIAEEKS